MEKLELAAQLMSEKVGQQITPNMITIEGVTPEGGVFSARFVDDGKIKTVVCSVSSESRPSVHLQANS